MGNLEGAVQFSIVVVQTAPTATDLGIVPTAAIPAALAVPTARASSPRSVRSQGVPLECMGSFGIARYAHLKGFGISIAQARAERGALVFIGINEGQGGIPGVDPGHIARSLGNGQVVEARNHRAGILVDSFDNRGWDWASHDPWLWNPSSQPPPLPIPAPEEEQMPEVIGLGHDNASNQEPVLTFVFKGGPNKRGMVLSQYGARIALDINGGNDAPLGGNSDPKTIGIPGTELITGIDVDEKSRVPSADGKTDRVRIRAIGAEGGQWPGVADA